MVSKRVGEKNITEKHIEISSFLKRKKKIIIKKTDQRNFHLSTFPLQKGGAPN